MSKPIMTKEIKLSDWLTCKKELLELGFAEEELEKALVDIGYIESDLTDVKPFQQEPTYHTPRLLTRKGLTFTKKEYQGEWEKEIRVSGSEWRIKAQYQGLKHGKLIFQLLQNRFNWFDSFKKEIVEKSKPIINNRTKVKDIPEEYLKLTVQELIELSEPKEVKTYKSLWGIYEMYRGSYAEIYLETEFGTLYVPIKAIINRDWNLIENRMKNYAQSYHDPINLSGFGLNHRGRTKEEYRKDKIDDYNKMIKPLESKEAQQLEKYLTQ